METIVCPTAFIRQELRVLMLVRSMLMTQPWVVNKVALNRSTHKTRVCIDQLAKM